MGKISLSATVDIESYCPYKIGDIYHTTNSTHPSTIFPGTTWQAITTFLLGASAAHPAGSTGGEETHILTADEMPQHLHTVGSSLVTGTEYENAGGTGELITYGAYGVEITGERTERAWIARTNASGGWEVPHNNMPPYTAVYIWKRLS